jgi:hypothetical protein
MQLMLEHGFALAALLPAVAVGCGGGLGAGDPSSYDGFREHFMTAVCTQSVSCSVAPSVASCKASYQEGLLMITTRAGVASGRIRYDAAKASSCLAYMDRAYAATPCSITAFATVDKTGMDDCDSVLTGTVADGGPCLVSLECVSGTCQPADPLCYPGDQCCPGTCAPKVEPTPLGGGCSVASPGANCVKGTACVASLTTTLGTCQVPSTVAGTPCETTAQCAPPLYCAMEFSVTPTAGTCQPAIASGAPCNRDVYMPCDDWREYCHAATSTCSPAAAVGAPCDADNACRSDAQCIGGTCVASPGLYGHCDTVGGLVCLGSLQCSPSTHTCERSPAPASCI